MHYRKFIIQNYRAITGPLEINVEKNSLLPIIGINESGKTTILHAIFAFDYFNDTLNDNGRHLKDVSNLYQTEFLDATVGAEISIDGREFSDILSIISTDLTKMTEEKDEDNLGKEDIPELASIRRKFKSLESIIITRNLKTKLYDSNPSYSGNNRINNAISKYIIGRLPYILFFDDFRDSIDERIEIIKKDGDNLSGWLAILEQLFKQTDKSFSVFKLAKLEERNRKSVLAKIRRHLNTTLTKEWQNFRLDETDALQINIDFEEETVDGQPGRKFLKLEIIETDASGDEHYFFIRDRSKGFFWFFNFVMKLEFNPKIVSSTGNAGAIYLLDEPGSYLHASAQSKLCQKLKLISLKNNVLYCTHSHYLLNPEVIPLSSIQVADKNGNGNVRLIPIHEYDDNTVERRTAFQPVTDALRIKPFILDLNYNQFVIVEGIYDYYAMEMLKGRRDINILPSVGANSIAYYISMMIAWRVRFCALWDNDEEGRKEYNKAKTIFGSEIADKHFHLLPIQNSRLSKCILQDLFAGEDIKMMKETLKLPRNSSFQKVIASLYYAPDKKEIIEQVSSQTKERFASVFDSLTIS